ncbi:MAG: diaminopimelate decarboxylase [Kiritimatiellae bacterium]|nr:diaminopimelate decarboxylase [Kiritimatiellia bacterium]
MNLNPQSKPLPIPEAELADLASRVPTPFHVYDAAGIAASLGRLQRAFAWHGDFREYFAVKATPIPAILRLLASCGAGADCSSLAELVMAERCGLSGDMVMFTSNDTPDEEFAKARRLGAIVNLDDISHIGALERCAGLPDLVCCRYNPGPLKQGNAIIGKPEEAKYGFTRAQLFDGFRILRDKGVRRFGLHTMVASNELNPQYFVETASMVFKLAAEISRELGITFELLNFGGGIGIPYRPGDVAVDLDAVGDGIRECYRADWESAGLPRPRLCLECGRMVTGPYGCLVSRVLHIKHTYRDYAGLDACMANLMRPALYGAYHHISVLGKEDRPKDHVYDVTGSLCENNDKFAIGRVLPELERGDLVAIHDTGAHGSAMGFQYNGKLRCAEYLRTAPGKFELIRRAETLDDYFATLVW